MDTPKRHKEILRHMLGADPRYRKKDWGFRNHFSASEGHADLPDLRKMVDAGLIKPFEKMGSISFKATKEGALAIGFKPYQLRKTNLAS